MKILHISNGYADSKVHSNLAKNLEDLGVEQAIYCPVREMLLNIAYTYKTMFEEAAKSR